jgi:hypothetical protein
VLTHDHGMDIERDDLTLGSVMMVELWTRKRDGDVNGYSMEDTSGYKK